MIDRAVAGFYPDIIESSHERRYSKMQQAVLPEKQADRKR